MNVGVAKVVYIDDNHMVVYECYSHDRDGYCVEEDAYIELLSRSLHITNDNIQRMYDAAARACYKPHQFTLTVHNGTFIIC